MEYKEIPYKLHYIEEYLPNKRCRNSRKHLVKEDAAVRIPVVKRFPVACIIHHKEKSGDEEIRYTRDGFWQQAHPSCTEEKMSDDLSQWYGFIIPDKGSEEDVEQGWKNTSVPVKNDREQQIESKKMYEQTHVVFEDRFWFKVEEPFYRTDFDIYGSYASASVNVGGWSAVSGQKEAPIDRRIAQFAYSLKDRELLQKSMQKLKENYHFRNIRTYIEDVDVLKPELFHFGEHAELEIREKAYDYLPRDLARAIGVLYEHQGDSLFRSFIRDHLGSYIVGEMKAAGKPYYRMSQDEVQKAVRRLLDTMADLADNADIPF